MAQIIRIKRSAATATPSSLQEGELAYSEQSDNLFIGTNGGGSIEKIGGAADVSKLSNIEANADVTDATNVDAAGAVMEADYNANTILSANSDNTPAALNIPEQRLVGRITGNNIDALTAAQVRSLLNVEDAAAADQNAGEVAFTPYGNIAATDVQVAIQELDNEKLALAGGTMSGFITLHASPTGTMHAATKAYVDSVAQGLDAKPSVKLATTGNVTLSGTQTIDGIGAIADDRVLVHMQTNEAENGIYAVSAGSWSRVADANEWDELVSAFVFVEEGSTYGNTGWTCTADAGGTLGSTDVLWSQFSGSGSYTADGNGITLNGTQFELELDGSTLTKGASGVKVAGGGINDNEINTSAAIQFSKMENLTTGRALVSDGSGDVSVSVVTSTEIGYLDGVSSSIQTQLGTKLEDITGESIGDLSDVSIGTPGSGDDGKVLYYNFSGGNFQIKDQILTDQGDFPSSYSGHGGKIVVVKAGADGVEFTNTIDGGTF